MISVIIPTYNAALLIERAIRSVLAQKDVSDFEILVVDDGSTDHTLEVVKAIDDARIKIFQQPENRGPAAARNRGLFAASGEYCALLDGDDFWEPDFLKQTAAFLTAHPQVVAVSVMQCHKIPGREPVIVPRDTGIAEPVVLPDFFAFWAQYQHVCTGSVLMKTSVARATGGQREDLRICEDLEFWARLATLGPWGFIPEVLFTSDGGAVTRRQGWLAKNRKRWASAVPVKVWERRLLAAVPEVSLSGYQKMRGRISRNLCYSLLLAGKTTLARREVLDNGSDFPRNRLNGVFSFAAKNAVLWALFAWTLQLREFLRGMKI